MAAKTQFETSVARIRDARRKLDKVYLHTITKIGGVERLDAAGVPLLFRFIEATQALDAILEEIE